MISGLDTNILCFALDPAFAENKTCKPLLLNLSPEHKIALNPTIIHESYHVLVFKQKWPPATTRQRLVATLNHPYVEFYNQSRRVSLMGLELAIRYNLGGRDALIIANMMANNVPTLCTHDDSLLALEKLTLRKFGISFQDPISPKS